MNEEKMNQSNLTFICAVLLLEGTMPQSINHFYIFTQKIIFFIPLQGKIKNQ